MQGYVAGEIPQEIRTIEESKKNTLMNWFGN